jgi:hypothetical protein
MVGRTRTSDRPTASPMIISESGDHIVIALEVEKAALFEHRRFLESLSAIVAGYESIIAVARETREEGGD